MLDTIATVVFVLASIAGLAAPLVSGPYGGGFRWATRLDDSAKAGLAFFFGLLGAMLALHVLAIHGAI